MKEKVCSVEWVGESTDTSFAIHELRDRLMHRSGVLNPLLMETSLVSIKYYLSTVEFRKFEMDGTGLTTNYQKLELSTARS